MAFRVWSVNYIPFSDEKSVLIGESDKPTHRAIIIGKSLTLRSVRQSKASKD